MKRFLYKLGAQSVMTAVTLLLIFSPYQALMAQAQIAQNQITNSSPPAATPAATTPPTNSGSDIGCTVVNLINGNSGGTFALCLTNVVYIFTVGIGSGFAYVAAYFFDLATQLSLNGTAYALTFVSTGWTTARDLANMAFLFILLFIAFQILLSADTANTQSTLAAVIVIALLVNFSFFFTRLVIDAGNILSIEFYNSIQAPPLSATTAAAGVSATVASGVNATANAVTGITNDNTKDLTASIMGMLQLQNLFNTQSFNAFFNGNSTTGQPAAGFMVTAISLTFLYIAAGIMFWLLSIMFITTGVKFLTRIVVLWFLIIFSPLAFVARAIPQFRGYFDKWRGLLFAHAFYPVAFMFIFLILTNFASQLSCTVNGAAVANCTGLINDVFSSLGTANSSTSAVAAIGYAVANVGIRLGFVIAILYMGMQAAQNVSVMGAGAAASAGRWFGGKAVQIPAGILGFGGRQLVGSRFKTLSENPTLAARAQRTGAVGSLWRGTQNVTKKLANATYDVRNAPGSSLVKKIAQGATGGLVNTGKAATKGYVEQAKEKAEKLKKDKAERAAIIRDDLNRQALERIDADIRAGGRVHAPADVDRVRNMNKREVEALNADQLANVAHLLKESQNKTVQDSDKYTDDEKERVNRVADPVNKVQKIIVDELRKLNSNLTTTTSAIVDTNTRRGAVVNRTSAGDMSTDLRRILTTLGTDLRDAETARDSGKAEDIKSDMNHVRHAIKSSRDLTRSIPSVPAHAGRAAGEVIAN